MSLTPAQRDALGAIERHIRDHGGVPPTVDELRQALGLRSKSGVQRLLDALEQRGFIARRTGLARGIALVKAATAPGRAAHDMTPELLAMLERVMWAPGAYTASQDKAPRCVSCEVERPADVTGLCRCELGRTVARGRAAMAQGREAAE